MNLNENIKRLRIASGYNQQQMAKMLGVTKQCVSNWENDNVMPSVEMLVKVAAFYSVSTDELLGLTNENTLNLSGLDEEESGHIRNLVNDLRKHKA
ncbi:MAG: helix-turn-helix transcriptional regulator [Clostridia bacterium]|nr:helix-turn-helix transcriptional regulator [Clostridia bacterium]